MEIINKLIDFDIRHVMFRDSIRFIDYELIEGDILEFGVYTGRSLALLSHYHNVNKNSIHSINFERKLVGFDSFNGLPDSENHPRWKKNMFGINHSYHPISSIEEPVTPDVVYKLFEECNLPKPYLEVGNFDITVNKNIKNKYNNVALVHIDCDLYDSTKTVLLGIESLLQEGTVLLFDDWFNFRGNKNKGEQKAFYEFFKNSTNWNFIEYHTYATFGKSFIVTK